MKLKNLYSKFISALDQVSENISETSHCKISLIFLHGAKF
jgi:hypothetical protein